MSRIVLQIAVFIFITLSAGYIFEKNNMNFFIGMLLGASFQYILNYCFYAILNMNTALKNKQLENERIKEFSYQGIEVECPCSRKIKDFIPIRLNAQNRYKCKECQKTISVYVTPSTALATEPIENTDTLNPEIIKDGIS